MRDRNAKRTQIAGELCGEGYITDIVLIAKSLQERSRVCLRVQGSSMLPWVRSGDIAILRKVSPDEVQRGNIVLFRREERFIVHRIVERCSRNGQTILVTKGDANPRADGVIAMPEILGRVERIYRGGRRIEFDSRGKRALGVLIARVSCGTQFWAALVQAHRITTRPVRRLLRMLRPPRPTSF